MAMCVGSPFPIFVMYWVLIPIATPLNMITLKYNIMGHETGIIKGNKTKYFKKSENRKVATISKYINLGVNSDFNIDDVVAVLPINEYETLIANNTNDDELNKLNETITDLNKELSDKETAITNLNNTNERLTKELAELNKENATNLSAMVNLKDVINGKDKKLTEIMAILKHYDIKQIDDLNTLLSEYKIALSYFSDCLVAYEKQGRFKRFLKENPTNEIAKPPLKLIDYKGNKAIATSDEIKANKIDDSIKSE